MKKRGFFSLVVLVGVWTTSAFAIDSIPCGTSINSPQAAAACIEDMQQNAEISLMAMALAKKHLGDLSSCATARSKSYFTNESLEAFSASLGGQVQECELLSNSRYKCTVVATGNNCYVSESGSKPNILGDNPVRYYVTGNSASNANSIVSFHPVN